VAASTREVGLRLREVCVVPQGLDVEQAWQSPRSALAVRLCASDKDLRFPLGNISNRPKTFTIVGLWHPEKKPVDTQRRLFA